VSASLIFTDAAQLLLAGQIVNMAVAVELELLNETLRLWRGQGGVTTNDGREWEGLGAFGDISGLNFGYEAATDFVTMTLSGLNNELAQAARDQESQMRGRTASVYVLLSDSDWRPVDMPYLCQMAIIDRAALKYSDDTYILELTAEPLFASKHLPTLNLVTDADQQARHPGDKIFKRVGFTHTIFWSQ